MEGRIVFDRAYSETLPQPRCRLRRLSTTLLILVIATISPSLATTAFAAQEKPPTEAALTQAPAAQKPAKKKVPKEKGATAATGAFYERVVWGPKLKQLANIWASATPNSPAVILVHGGGWRKQGGLTYLKKEALGLQAHGFTVFSINYQQDSPTKAAFPLEPNEIMAATQWAIAHAASYNANSAKVVLVGGSAGGNLVALAAEQLDAAHAGTVKAVVSLSGPMNFQTLIPLVDNGVITNHNFIVSIYQALGGSEDEGYFGGEEDDEEEVLLTQALELEGSPALNIPSHNCPEWLLFTSEDDLVPASQSEEMYSDLLAAKCKATLQVLPGSKHAFAYWNQVSDTIYDFIKAQ
jgi:acetyl esterase/lipase